MLFDLSAAARRGSLAVFSYDNPFIQPLPLWDAWPWLLLPLCAGIAIVYKSVKCESMRRVPWEATVIFAWILIFMATAAAILAGLVKILESKN